MKLVGSYPDYQYKQIQKLPDTNIAPDAELIISRLGTFDDTLFSKLH